LKGKVAIGVGTSTSGVLLVSDDEKRKRWRKVGPFLKGESVNCLNYDSKSKTLFAATHTNGVFVSKDFGRTWKQSNNGLHVRKAWTVEFAPGNKGSKRKVYVGTQYGHLFRSSDLGANWEEVTGLFEAPKRNDWGVDWGFGTVGLCIHTIRMDQKNNGNRFFIVSSGGGPYRTDDGGEKWSLLNKGVMENCPTSWATTDVWGTGNSDPSANLSRHLAEVHKCTHKLVVSNKDPSLIYQQNHCGVYKSEDMGESWVDISSDEKSRHGFPIGLVEDGKGSSQSLFTIPMAAQGDCKKHNSCIIGQLVVQRSQDKGKSWERVSNGLKKKNHTCVLRDAMSAGESGVFFGTTTGEVYGSQDLGENWSLLLEDAGRVQGVSTFHV
jgi:photosystem II stability/assembly factor-like uncharacterized protein